MTLLWWNALSEYWEQKTKSHEIMREALVTSPTLLNHRYPPHTAIAAKCTGWAIIPMAKRLHVFFPLARLRFPIPYVPRTMGSLVYTCRKLRDCIEIPSLVQIYKYRKVEDIWRFAPPFTLQSNQRPQMRPCLSHRGLDTVAFHSDLDTLLHVLVFTKWIAWYI